MARFEPSERLGEVDGGVCKSLNSSDSLCIAFVWAWGFLVGFGLNKGGLKLAVLEGGGGCQPPCMPTGSAHMGMRRRRRGVSRWEGAVG